MNECGLYAHTHTHMWQIYLFRFFLFPIRIADKQKYKLNACMCDGGAVTDTTFVNSLIINILIMLIVWNVRCREKLWWNVLHACRRRHKICEFLFGSTHTHTLNGKSSGGQCVKLEWLPDQNITRMHCFLTRNWNDKSTHWKSSICMEVDGGRMYRLFLSLACTTILSQSMNIEARV